MRRGPRARTPPPAATRNAPAPAARNARRSIRGSGPVLQLVPGRHGCELEQRASAVRVAVVEVPGAVVERDLEEVLLQPVVEPGAAEDELAQPVDERLTVHDRELLPVADEVVAERALRLRDPGL